MVFSCTNMIPLDFAVLLDLLDSITGKLFVHSCSTDPVERNGAVELAMQLPHWESL